MGGCPSPHEATRSQLSLDSPSLCPITVQTSASPPLAESHPHRGNGWDPPRRWSPCGAPSPPSIFLHSESPRGPPPLCSLSLHTRSQSRWRLCLRASHTQWEGGECALSRPPLQPPRSESSSPARAPRNPGLGDPTREARYLSKGGSRRRRRGVGRGGEESWRGEGYF